MDYINPVSPWALNSGALDALRKELVRAEERGDRHDATALRHRLQCAETERRLEHQRAAQNAGRAAANAEPPAPRPTRSDDAPEYAPIVPYWERPVVPTNPNGVQWPERESERQVLIDAALAHVATNAASSGDPMIDAAAAELRRSGVA